MAGQSTSIIERLCEAESPCSLPDWEGQDGYYVATCRLSSDDISGLIEIAGKWPDPDWPGDDSGLGADREDLEMLPVTAWRALADLKASESVEPLIDMLCELDGEFDDWTSTELPHVFGRIGKPAIDALLRLARDADLQSFIRLTAVESLHRVAENHAETRDHIVSCLAKMMTEATQSDVRFNTMLLMGLVELRAIEAAEPIERAFASDVFDVGMMGDWEDVRRELGVEGLGLKMPQHPHNSIEQLRRSIGIGIFSDKPIFADGETKPEAERAYFERASDLFSRSREAEQVVDQYGDLGWFQMFLEFSFNYRGEIVDEISIAGVDDFVFGYVPRKVSTNQAQAASIILELTMFWEYLDRVFELPDAKSIVEWLRAEGMVARLEAELSDPANFGMAKSIFMSGINSGYDMTSEVGMAEFMMAYNQSLERDNQSTESAVVPEHAPAVSRRDRVGRNDPCPCGSGRKFKKCCR